MTFWPKLCVAILAAWRLSHLLSQEDGPWDLIARFRRRLGSGWLGKLMDCFYCLSLWVALPAAVFVGGTWVELALLWLAISGGACILERVTERPAWEPAPPEAAESEKEERLTPVQGSATRL